MLWFQKRGELFASPRSYTVHKGGEGASNKPTRICNVKQWWICPHGASFAQLQVHIRSPFQVLMADCQRVPFENSLRRKLWEHAHGRNIFLTWLMMLMGTCFQNAPLNLPAMLRCSKPPRIRSRGKSSNSFHLSQPFAKCISSVPFILYLFFGKGWEKFQRKIPLSRWWIYETQQVLTLGAGRWKQGLKHWTSPHTLAHPIFNRFRSFCFTLPLLQNRQTLKSRHGFYQKFRKSRRSAKILVMRGSINKGSNASNRAQ